jgi:ribonucleoside-diphosphate reductase alpha chain
VIKNKDYGLINPRTGKIQRTVKAKDIFDLIVTMNWRTGDPGLIFIDEINRKNQLKEIGLIEATNPCVTADTLVNSDKGLLRITEIQNRHSVVSLDGKLYKISWAGKTGVKKVYKIKTKVGYEVKATADHKILTEKGWKTVKDLTIKDKLIIKKGTFGKLHVGKKIALMLGWLVGDGFITKGVKDVVFVFNTNEKLELLPIFKEYLDKINGKPVKPNVRYNEISLKYSARIAKKFFNLGIKSVRADKKEIPEIIFKADKKTVANFCSALFSADGSVQGTVKKGVSIRLASSSLKLLKQVQLLLLQFDVYSKVYENRRKAGFRILPDSNRKPKEYFCKAQHELIISRKSMFTFMKEIGFCLKSKKIKFELIKPREVYRDNFDTSVENIDFIGKQRVYDLTEPLKHAFIANGIVVHNCAEQPLYDYESCNLGSINLAKMAKDKRIDWEKLKKTVHLAVHFLDNVIDVNKYPLAQIAKITKQNRKIGLGVMGFADLLLKLEIPYDSSKALKFAEKLMQFIAKEARKKSQRLAEKRGSFPNFNKSGLKHKYKKMRNATVTTIAPTGTISIIADTSSGIEPLFAISFIRTVMEGARLLEVNKLFEQAAKKKGIYSKELMMKIARHGSLQKIYDVPGSMKKVFKTAHDISPEWHVKMQAAFQKHTDNAVSKTINMPHDSRPEDIRKAFLLAYKLKCKGLTVYRYGSKKEQVLYIGRHDGEEHVRAESEYAGGCPAIYCPY